MSKRKEKKEPQIAVASAEETESYGGATAAQADSAETTETETLDPETRQAERNDWREKALRAKADFQNLQRRAEAERHNAVRFANTEFARSLLVLVDDLGRTLEAGRQETDRETLVKSVEILNDHFAKILAEHHVTPIEAKDQPFDPALHQALVQKPCTDREPGMVVEVLEVGYRLHDRVLRPAKVVVSSAPPEAEAGESDGKDPAGPSEGTNDDANL